MALVKRDLLRCMILTVLLGAMGCNKGPALHPVTGTVSYRGQPLRFGLVMFQPAAGSPSSGQIRPDGSFELEIPGIGRGAVAGRHAIVVLCRENQAPQGSAEKGESAPGRPLIPARYARYETSGLERNVPAESTAPVILELTY